MPANKPPLRAFANPHAVSSKAKNGEEDDKQASDPTTSRKQCCAKQVDEKQHDGPD